MISLSRWGRWFPKLSTSREETRTTTAPVAAPAANRQRTLPRPALRWVAEGRIALRAFDFNSDVDAICSFQPETYGVNFPEFEYSQSFANAFRHDLRRATLDSNNGLFVLDDGREKNSVIGFLWVVICQNNWTGERYGYINNLYVLPQRRGQGLAGELMRQSDDFFRARGIRRVRLTVTKSNQSAIGLYSKSGYRVQRSEMEKEL